MTGMFMFLYGVIPPSLKQGVSWIDLDTRLNGDRRRGQTSDAELGLVLVLSIVDRSPSSVVRRIVVCDRLKRLRTD